MEEKLFIDISLQASKKRIEPWDPDGIWTLGSDIPKDEPVFGVVGLWEGFKLLPYTTADIRAFVSFTEDICCIADCRTVVKKKKIYVHNSLRQCYSNTKKDKCSTWHCSRLSRVTYNMLVVSTLCTNEKGNCGRVVTFSEWWHGITHMTLICRAWTGR